MEVMVREARREREVMEAMETKEVARGVAEERGRREKEWEEEMEKRRSGVRRLTKHQQHQTMRFCIAQQYIVVLCNAAH